MREGSTTEARILPSASVANETVVGAHVAPELREQYRALHAYITSGEPIALSAEGINVEPLFFRLQSDMTDAANEQQHSPQSGPASASGSHESWNPFLGPTSIDQGSVHGAADENSQCISAPRI